MQKDDCIFLDDDEEDSDADLGEDLNEGLADDDEMELEGNDVNDLSSKDESDLYTSALCKVTLAKPFYKITLQVSIRGAARISDIVVFIDQITNHLSSCIYDKQAEYPAALRNACHAGIQLTNKYYTLTDCSPLYRVAMVLHPLFKDEYFKIAKWPPQWIDEAIRLTCKMWETYYKLPPVPTNNQPPSSSTRPQTGVLAGLASASEARGASTSTDPLTTWLSGGLSLTSEGQPVNPLKWWMQQRRANNTHGGLLQMTLDVLSCPDLKLNTRGYPPEVPGYPPGSSLGGAGAGAGAKKA
ncbi:hypothetical protein PCANC_25377 [Puccinia coronata f. sp. avenae]|uniref:hAT-like transposase RNase-H fold domain-containing protein n=1 Tax=Puccinia coronata f. sp. avenae TaxID=200324 RepID=A0A2N5S1E1_9BASI|nr:hypothetical protein PCANC_25377 [Puccinia coronata f. sp. avenae]